MGSKSHVLGLERQAERIALSASARLAPNDWSNLEVRIVNVSRTGFKAECGARLMTGSCVSIEVPGIGWTEAQVEWQRDGSIGAKFLEPINLARSGWSGKQDPAVPAELLIERARQSSDSLRPIIQTGRGS